MRERRTHGSVRGLRREPLVYSTDRKSHMKMKLVLMEVAIYGKKHKMQTN